MMTHQPPSDDAAVYVISIAAEFAGMHTQTLWQYDRLGLVTPRRSATGAVRSRRIVGNRSRTLQIYMRRIRVYCGLV